ncbi:MAG: hypothetical protein L0332_00620 [Chloroflexi bacterium]|nr:hypothetical protein [Chloroflexota bacterium]MCI0577589.1 hypothetical protein [Chloroflexota bacterium]MCI0644191.1 hypothetical protein [Chloroflexota bacterium]MCI0725226.1 hypothetical protein [Chloroflexota bacterium]
MSQVDSMDNAAVARRRAAYSNFAHIVVGLLLGAVALLAALEAFGLVRGGWRYLWPGLLVGAGLFVPLFILWAARRYRRPLAQLLADHQQQQHFLLSGLLFAGGLAEFLSLAGVLPFLLALVMPLALILIGLLFIVHEQHGTAGAVARAVLAHRLLGGTLVLAGLARAVAVVLRGTDNLVWVVLLMAAAAQLLAYREPEGAYMADPEHSGHH